MQFFLSGGEQKEEIERKGGAEQERGRGGGRGREVMIFALLSL